MYKNVNTQNLEEFYEAIKKVFVRKINGKGVDENGNINTYTLDKPIKCITTYTDGSGTTKTTDCIKFNSCNTQNGNNIAFGAGSNTIVGGGESWSAQLNELNGVESKNLYLCADAHVYIKPNCQTFANAKTFTFSNAGDLTVPRNVTANGVNLNNGIVAQSLGTNGYVKFANGLIVQWGLYNGGYGSYRSVHITYPIAFPSGVYSIVLGEYSPNSDSSDYNNCWYSGNASGFTIRLDDHANGASWLAVGR